MTSRTVEAGVVGGVESAVVAHWAVIALTQTSGGTVRAARTSQRIGRAVRTVVTHRTWSTFKIKDVKCEDKK